MKIFSGTSNPELVNEILSFDALKGSSGEIEISKFRDGEIHVKFNDNIRGKDIFLVQSISNPVNDNLMELLIMVDAAKRASASRITAVIPYYAYARQDRKEQPRVSITAKLVANILVASGVDRIVTMDLHSPQIQGFFDIPMDHLYAMPKIVEYFRKIKGNQNDFVIVAPDVGRAKSAVSYAKALSCDFAIIAKERKNGETTEAITLIGDVNGKRTIVIDDLTTTGGTLVGAATLLKEKGARSVIAAVTHNVLSNDGINNINSSYISEFVVTNTIKNDLDCFRKPKIISVAELFAGAISAIHNNESVSSLFDY